jgi:DNA-directed RNA polymerase subunit H (RpoH/RPB5)
MLLRPDIQDSAAMDFLTKFTDSLQKYSEMGHAYISSLGEADKMLATINVNKANLPKVPQNERDKATANLNALITKYNDLYKVTLPKQRDELEVLGKELMTLK